MTATYPVTVQTRPTRLRERVGYNREAVHAVLDEAILCHLGVVVDGRPVVLPQLHARVGDTLYLHGSTGAGMFRPARTGGVAVCVTVTLLDGLVLARAALNHSVNYRSVVIHGVAELVTDRAEQEAALAALVDAVVPGRSDHVRGADGKELAKTAVLRLPLEAVSLKTRSGAPHDDPTDLDLPYWAGVIPLAPQQPGAPLAAPELAADVALPDHVREWRRGSRPT